MNIARVSYLRILFLCLTILLCAGLFCACAASVKVVDLIDITAMDARDYQSHVGADLIDEDDEWLYYLDRTRAHGGYVEYSDGSRRSIHDALTAGDITRDDLVAYGVLHTAYSKQYADEPVLENPPTLTVLCGDASVDAYRSSCTWAAGCYLAEPPLVQRPRGTWTR